MGYRKRILRRMTPQARRLGKLAGELESVARRLKALVPVVQDLEMWQRAEAKRQQHYAKGQPVAKETEGQDREEDEIPGEDPR